MCFCAEVLKMAPAQAHFCAHFCADRRRRPRRTNSADFDYTVRMFFPDLGIILEDPATGSANCALIGHLGTSKRIFENEIQKISQGGYIGRPSCLKGQYLSHNGVKIGGEIVDVMEGILTLK